MTDFDKLRAAVGRLGSRDAFLYAFDLLELERENIRPYEWHVRRATLRSQVKRAGAVILLSENINGGDGASIFAHACRWAWKASNATILPLNDLDRIKPSEMLALPDNPRFVIKH